MDSQFGVPAVVSSDGAVTRLEQISLGLSGVDSGYDEGWMQDLVFRHPECLPIGELDSSYRRLIPVCRELPTQAGPIDVLYATDDGRLVVVEAKLWRNPDARRRVVAQILDYAKELSLWSYEDLQRQVSQVTKRSGNVLFEVVAREVPGLHEERFVDAVSRNLAAGRFMLMIVGDGIREGAGAIAEFLHNFGTLDFSLALVELAVFQFPTGGFLVQPRVLARSLTIKRSVISLEKGTMLLREQNPSQPEEEELSESQRSNKEFWSEFIRDLRLDDKTQELPNASVRGNMFLPMPPSGSTSWLTVYLLQSSKRAGVFLTFTRGSFADAAYHRLLEQKAEIEAELGATLDWRSSEGKHDITESRGFPDLRAAEHRAEIKAYLADVVNRFVNVFRPRLARISQEP